MAALEQTRELFLLTVDLLAFEVQRGLRVLRFEAIDVTPPAHEGEPREILYFDADPLATPEQSRDPLGGIQTLRFPALPTNLSPLFPRMRAALRWFVKGVGSRYQPDEFMFLWISLEILVLDSDVAVLVPYRAPCGHEIPTCPECERGTEKKLLGETIKHFLEERCGLDATTAQALWRMRQVMHGAVALDDESLAQLPNLTQVLHAALTALLKREFGLLPEQPPLVAAEGTLVFGGLGLGGSRALMERDLAPSPPEYPEALRLAGL